jgi:hypothetical protein
MGRGFANKRVVDGFTQYLHAVQAQGLRKQGKRLLVLESVGSEGHELVTIPKERRTAEDLLENITLNHPSIQTSKLLYYMLCKRLLQ